jgi:NADH-quinone oxidoreductase subunit K
MIPLNWLLIVSSVLFAISVAGMFINRKNLILLLMCVELLLLAVNFNFVAFSRYLGDIHGQIFVFFVAQHQRRRPEHLEGLSAWKP